MLLSHLYLYRTIAKPVNEAMTDAAINHIVPDTIRTLQIRWDRVITHRAVLLTAAMLLLTVAAVICGK